MRVKDLVLPQTDPLHQANAGPAAVPFVGEHKYYPHSSHGGRTKAQKIAYEEAYLNQK